jgi:hypothetical protein
LDAGSQSRMGESRQAGRGADDDQGVKRVTVTIRRNGNNRWPISRH